MEFLIECSSNSYLSSENFSVLNLQEGNPLFGEIIGKKETKVYYYVNGNIGIISEYLDEKKHGIFKEYYETGEIYIKASYEHGKLNGNFISYYPNGNMMRSCKYVDGVLHGLFKLYYENETPKEETNYFKGDKYGRSLMWSREGEVVRSIFNNLTKRRGIKIKQGVLVRLS